ncbi:type II secretion system protein [Campylobacter sp. RM12640]|uniref:type II secretion system protein n=1 Tax=unclassified Campylobacter TaxID=2593542 RepID=UPI003014F297|nr:type II secretion system protein [Campylobacter sp. RM12640]MBZ7990106.1 type II secretion system protein [Campylobacter sp. RM12635]
MKKGFTMIELIFVIVILGILAAVAIPKLNATRDDAEIAKALSNFSTIISDISSYYTAKGDFAANIKDMTNVPLKTGSGTTDTIQVKNKDCLTITLPTAGATSPAAGSVKFAMASGSDAACTSALTSNTAKALFGGNDLSKASSSYTLQIGGSNISL